MNIQVGRELGNVVVTYNLHDSIHHLHDLRMLHFPAVVSCKHPRRQRTTSSPRWIIAAVCWLNWPIVKDYRGLKVSERVVVPALHANRQLSNSCRRRHDFRRFKHGGNSGLARCNSGPSKNAQYSSNWTGISAQWTEPNWIPVQFRWNEPNPVQFSLQKFTELKWTMILTENPWIVIRLAASCEMATFSSGRDHKQHRSLTRRQKSLK